MLLFGAKLGGSLFKKFGQPGVAGELLAGVVLGPYVLSLVSPSGLIASMAEIGLVFLVLLISMGIDWRKTGSDAGVHSRIEIVRGTLIFAAIFMIGMLSGWGFYTTVIVCMMAILTSTAVISRTLMASDHMKSHAGQTMMSILVIGEMAGVVALMAVAGFVENSAISMELTASLAVVMGGFFLLLGRGGERLVNGFTSFVHRYNAEDIMLGLTLVLAFAFSALTESLNMAALLGVFFAGALLSRSSQNTSIARKVRDVGEGFFTPFFFASIGLGLNIFLVQAQIYYILGLVAALMGVKWVCTTMTFKMFRYSTHDSVKIGSGMISLSELTVVMASMAFSATNPALLSVLVTAFVITNVASPFITGVVLRSSLGAGQFFRISGDRVSYRFRKD